MKPDGSLPHSQDPPTCLYPEPGRSNPCSHPTSRRPILILSFRLRRGLPSGLILSGFPTKTLYPFFLSPICATCLAHFSLSDSIILRVKEKKIVTFEIKIHLRNCRLHACQFCNIFVSAAYLWALSIYIRLTFKIYSSVIFSVLRNNCTAVDTFFLV